MMSEDPRGSFHGKVCYYSTVDYLFLRGSPGVQKCSSKRLKYLLVEYRTNSHAQVFLWLLWPKTTAVHVQPYLFVKPKQELIQE